MEEKQHCVAYVKRRVRILFTVHRNVKTEWNQKNLFPTPASPPEENDKETLKDFLLNEKQNEEGMEKIKGWLIQALEYQEVNTDEARKIIIHSPSCILFPVSQYSK